MVTLQDVSSQLMKPAKDLADWSFPLSQVLEKYYALLEQPCDINFGNAGLVIENSTSVYGRRVDHLSEKTLGLSQTIQNEVAESAKTKQGSKKKNKRLPVDLEDFVPHDLTKEIGKNINFKDGSQKPVKLISRRFPQLESSLVHLRTPIDIVDISGEIIGKKYSFRCNEYFDVNGMLVYECTEDDFKRSFLNKSSNDQSTLCTDPSTEADSDPLESSGYYSCASTIDCSHTSNEDCNNCSPFISDHNNICFSPIVEEDIDYNLENVDSVSVHPSENVIIDNSEIPNKNANQGTSNTESNDEVVDKSCYNSPLSEKELIENQLAEHKENNDSAEISSDVTAESLDENSSISVQHEAQCKKDNVDLKKTNKSTKTCDSNVDKSSPSEDLSTSRRRSKRISNMMSNMREMKSQAWKPIPLTKGVLHKPVKKRAVFKLPFQISSSKSTYETRKRKISESRKPECLVKFYLNEYELPNKKVTMYSPTRQTFTPLKQEELEEFQRSFDDCFKRTEEFQQTDYEAITNITMDLLGFQPSSYIDTKKDPMFDHIMYSPDLSIPDNTPLSSTELTVYPSPPSYSTPEASPISHNDLLRADSPPTLPNSSSDYQKLIENRMKEIFDESDVRTDLEEAVAKWHNLVRPKLAEAEQRAVFNIREYSARILNVLRRIEHRKCTFNSLVNGQEPFEVARYFSAILQLANANSVDIRTNNGHMELALLRADLASDCTEEEEEEAN